MRSIGEVSGVSSANSSKKRKSTSGTMFRCWSFQLMVRADLGHGTTADEKRKLLTEHLRSCTGHTMPRCVTCVAVFCDESLFSVPPDGAGLVSIQVQGYIQASSAKPHSTMRKWIDSAACGHANTTPVGQSIVLYCYHQFATQKGKETQIMT